MSTAIEVLGLEKKYGSGPLSVHTLKNINLKIHAGEFRGKFYISILVPYFNKIPMQK